MVLYCDVPLGSVLEVGPGPPDIPESIKKQEGARARPAWVYLMPREALGTLFLHGILKIASVGKGLVLSCSQGKGGVEGGGCWAGEVERGWPERWWQGCWWMPWGLSR